MILDFNNLSVEHLKRLNKTSIEIHNEFNDLTKEILNRSNKKVEDLICNVVSRHPYQSNLFEVCYTLTFIRNLSKEVNISKIIFSNYAIFSELKRIKEIRGKVVFSGGRKIGLRFSFMIKSAKDFLKDVFFAKRMYLSKSKARAKGLKRKLKLPIILIDTFALQDSIDNKRIKDRYYTGLLDHVTAEQREKIYFMPLILGRYSKKDLLQIEKNSKANLLFSTDFLSLTDYLYILLKLFRQTFDFNKRIFFSGYDLTDVIRGYFKRERFNNSTFQGLINYFFIRRLEKNGVKIELFIDWNENQPIDKGMIKGLHDFYPKVRVKGYRGFIVSYDYNLYLMPTDYEKENGVIPDEICVVGKALENRIKKFTDKIKVTTAPAFRFQGVFKNYEKISDGTKKILVALPIGVNESYDILTIVSKALILLEKEKKFQLLIKPHPVLNIDKLKKAMGSMWNKGFKMVNGDFNELVSQMDLLIGNASSTLIETLAYGIPVIVVGSKNSITQNPIDEDIDRRIWKIVYSVDELVLAINHYTNIKTSARVELEEIGLNIKNDYFMPVDSESVKNFLQA